MVQRPIIKLSDPREAPRPTGPPRNPPRSQGPGRVVQGQRFNPTFTRLKDALEKENPALELTSDPFGIAPDRALVFVTAGPVQDFIRAAEDVGLTVISEIEHDLNIPDEFESSREDGEFNSILYTTMPTLASIQQLLSLWRAYSEGETLPRGFTPFRHAFDLLVEIRVWGPEDRLPQSSRAALEENLPLDDADPVKLELEILPVVNQEKRNAWVIDARNRISELGGNIIDTCSISEQGFIYEALLVEMTTLAVRQMLDVPHDVNGLATVEGIQLILPQTLAQSPVANPIESETIEDMDNALDSELPIRCALFDGTTVASHPAIDGGVEIEDLNDIVRFSEVANRYHATSMASLILRGDLNADGKPLDDSRLLNIPILVDDNTNQATSPDSKLFVDVIHATLLRLFSGDEDLEHKIFVINFAVGITSQRYAGRISALARLLDWWAYTHGVLFVISAGNIFDDLILTDIGISEFENKPDVEKQRLIRQALRDFSYSRTLLAPAESINGLTVGALSEDLAIQSIETTNTIKLNGEHGAVTALASALGLGKLRSIKPDLVTSGGLHEYSLYPSGGDTRLRLRRNSSINGLYVASPGSGTGTTTTRSRGTSCATALTTRAILQAASALTTEGGPYQGQELARQDIALLSRALSVNSANWSDDMVNLYEEEKLIHGRYKSVMSKEQVAKYYGFGALFPQLMQECSKHRATLVGLGTLNKDQARIFDLPLPHDLSGDRIGRNLRVTIAWFSPIDSVGSSYKMATLEAFCDDEEEGQDNEWGLGMKSLHLDQRITARGSVWSRRLQHKRLTAPTFDENATIPIRVQCRDTANGNLNPDVDIRFALAVSFEVETTAEYDIHEQIFNKVRIRAQQAQ